MEILLEPTSNKLMVVTHWFTLIALSALRRSDIENTLSLMKLILRSILMDLQASWRSCERQNVVEKMMISVPPKFEAKITAIEESYDLDMLTVSELTSKLQAQEQRVSIRLEEKVEGAFRVSSRSNKAGNSKQNTFRRGNFSKGNNNLTKLFFHIKERAKKDRNNTQGVQQANVFEEDQVDDEHLFMASHLDKHLDSLTWLMDSGCTSHMTLKRCLFISLDTKDNPRVNLGLGRYTRAKGRATLDMENDSYYLKLDVADASAFSVTEDDSLKSHKRFGHFNYRTLQLIYSTKLVRDMPPISEVDSKCAGCELGKVTCYLSQNKALVFSIFKSFKKLVEVQSGITLRILRTDNGGEYTSNKFEDFLQKQGVIHQVTVPYSPQQNGVSKRKKKMTIEMARSMIKLSIQHLKVFGLISYCHIPDIKRSKLDAKAKKGSTENGIWMKLKGTKIRFLNETYHDEVNIPEFDIKDTTNTDVLRTRSLVDVYESCNSVIEPES
nr:retrovirus-related Pol polyprotein from transposon TNT 1-94 [Tanacetum cinerariifolium]